MLSRKRVLSIFQETGVLQEGHFLLTSGLHSAYYLQCAQVLQYPEYTEELCRGIVEAFKDANIDLVIGPALGGVLLSYEVGKQLKIRSIFAEREAGKMTLRRGFKIDPGQKVLVVEDVITTGGSVKEVIDLVEQSGGEVVGVGLLVDRSGGKVDFGVPTHALIKLDIETYSPETCPLCKQGAIPAIKPGSRNINK
ncbi:MAG TPA: orotate phosphoribosyltransferase [Clostridia bacterium]|nr:orotate phosphoribosyltransferase [Clostridia bacterium]